MQKPETFLKYIILVLVLLNLSTLGWLVFFRSPGNSGNRHESPAEYLTRELSLSPEQEEAYEEMRFHHHEAVEGFRRKAGGFRRSIHKILKGQALDSLRIIALSDSVGACQRNIELVTFYHFKEVRALCNAEQQQKFDSVIDEALQMMTPPHGPGPGRHEHGPEH
ncbi:MAG: periplasmic heavy metal sensor [Bacteroidota bacterium]